MEEFISRGEHEEFSRRLEEAQKRVDSRLKILEKRDEQLNKITSDLQSLARSVSGMVDIQEKYGDRLTKLENRDGERWREVSGYVITTIVGAVVMFALMKIGLM